MALSRSPVPHRLNSSGSSSHSWKHNKDRRHGSTRKVAAMKRNARKPGEYSKFGHRPVSIKRA